MMVLNIEAWGLTRGILFGTQPEEIKSLYSGKYWLSSESGSAWNLNLSERWTTGRSTPVILIHRAIG